MEQLFTDFFKQIFKNTTKLYLVLVNVVLIVFAIWFSNVGLLPFKNLGDFAFFAILALILGLYRPGWTFVFFVGTLALENINLAPKEIGLTLRPYQFFGFITIVAILVQMVSKRLAFALPKMKWFDALPIVFAIGGFVSALGAANKGVSFKQALIACSFVALYFLVRIYVQSLEDLKRVMPFFLSSSLVVMIYAIWQNVRFARGANSFEVMLGRPNATFAEADWLGIYLVFCLAVVLTILYKARSNNQETMIKQISNSKFQIPKNGLYLGSCILYLVLTFITLILTVSRSAWIGAVIVALGYLKLVLLYGKKDIANEKQRFCKNLLALMKQSWNWKGWFVEALKLLLLVAVSVAIIFVFHLTSFQLGNRAVSTGGLQKITIACQGGSDKIVPAQIGSVDELASYNCRHINLEDIEKEKRAGHVVLEVSRPDPNVNIRAEIYQKAIAQIKQNPILGIGWGSINAVLGTDERGAGLNASNIFLEVWLGSGLLGLIAFVVLLGYILAIAIIKFMSRTDDAGLVFVMLGLFAIIIPNLFNSGIFLGFVWVYLGIAVGLISEKKT
ncbi:MAG: O-antigen ligase family protein [Candidatus Moranbacteria bacterium]|nr:O-antigen ligase family protein [Candidatus Moranbacteria bacterium]